MEKSYHSSTIQRALDILTLFKDYKTLSFSEIKKLLGYNKTTLFRVLSTLQHNRYLNKKDNGGYQLGLNIFILGNRISAEYQLKKVAAPWMKKLAERTDLTVHLGILDGTNVIIIEKAEPNRMIQMVSRIGSSVPAHCTGQGKTLLAFSPKETVEKIINIQGLPRYTPQTITTADHLFTELANIRKLGFTIDNSEHEKDIRCVAVPILNETGKIEAALSITGTTTDFPGDDKTKKYTDILIEVREKIREEMGYGSKLNRIS
jgi:DNA-binding IclR family transcriptional regulator